MKIFIVLLLMIAVSAVFADPVVDLTLTAPDGNITGLGYGQGYLWALDQSSKTVYKLNPANGAVVDSWVCTQTGSRTPTGLTQCSNYVYVAAAMAPNFTNPYCYRYSTAGTYTSTFDLDC